MLPLAADPRNQPGRRLDKAGLVHHMTMSLRVSLAVHGVALVWNC